MRKILFSFITTIVMTTLLFFYLKPRYIELFKLHHHELSNTNSLFIFLLDAIICYSVAVAFYHFLEAIITPKVHFIIIEKCNYFFTSVISFAIYILFRVVFSNPKWIVLGNISPDFYIFVSWVTPMAIAFLFFMPFSDVDVSAGIVKWFADKSEKTEKTTATDKNTEELKETYTTIETAHNLHSIQLRLQKATELYDSVQTEEAKQQAQSIIDSMNEAICQYTKHVIIQKDQMILAEMEKQQRINDEVMQEI